MKQINKLKNYYMITFRIEKEILYHIYVIKCKEWLIIENNKNMLIKEKNNYLLKRVKQKRIWNLLNLK